MERRGYQSKTGSWKVNSSGKSKSCPFLDKAAFSCLSHRLSFLMYLVDDCMHFACNMQLRDWNWQQRRLLSKLNFTIWPSTQSTGPQFGNHIRLALAVLRYHHSKSQEWESECYLAPRHEGAEKTQCGKQGSKQAGKGETCSFLLAAEWHSSL